MDACERQLVIQSERALQSSSEVIPARSCKTPRQISGNSLSAKPHRLPFRGRRFSRASLAPSQRVDEILRLDAPSASLPYALLVKPITMAGGDSFAQSATPRCPARPGMPAARARHDAGVARRLELLFDGNNGCSENFLLHFLACSVLSIRISVAEAAASSSSLVSNNRKDFSPCPIGPQRSTGARDGNQCRRAKSAAHCGDLH